MLLWLGLILVAVFLQSSVFGMFPFLRAKPDIVLILVMAAAFSKGSAKGSAVGFAGGMAADFASGGTLGVNALIKVLLGYCFGSLRKKFELGSRSFQFISVFAASCASQAGFFLIMQVLGRPVSPALFGDVFIQSAFISACAGPFVFRMLESLKKYDRAKTD